MPESAQDAKGGLGQGDQPVPVAFGVANMHATTHRIDVGDLQGQSFAQAQALFSATRTLSYKVFYFTLYSLGLRLGEGLALRVGDIDAQRHRVHVRDAKGNRDRLVPLPAATLSVLRRFWGTHRNAELLFPNRHGGLAGARLARTPLDRGGVQNTLRQVALDCGLKKRSRRTACATAMPRT